MAEPLDVYRRGERDRLIRLLRAGSAFYARVYHRITVQGSCHLPKTGPAIVVCNHTSGLDPVIIQTFCPRLIRWMMAKEYFDLKLLRWIYQAVGAIPVERSGRDMAAMRTALRALEDGYVVGVFPEGKIESSRELIPFQSGIGLLALKTRAPVFPAYLDGNQRGKEMIPAFAVPSRIFLSFGPGVDLRGLGTSRNDFREASRRIQTAVDRLRNQGNQSTQIDL